MKGKCIDILFVGQRLRKRSTIIKKEDRIIFLTTFRKHSK